MEEEIWKDVPGYVGDYKVSSIGRVKSLKKLQSKILKPSNRSKDKNSYLTVSLCKEGKAKNYLVHQLVAIAFLDHIPDGFNVVVDHKNDIKTDNRFDNLQILTHRRNITKNKYRGNTNSVGVHWCEYRKKFLSIIQENGKQVLIGQFDDEKVASLNYKRARLQIEKGDKVSVIRKKLSSKYKGVTWHKREGKWRTQIKVNGKQKQIGSFKTEIEAHQAYTNYEKTLKNE